MEKIKNISIFGKFFISILLLNIILFLQFFLTQQYYWYFIALNILSILLLSLWVVDLKRTYQYVLNHRNDVALCFCLFFIALFMYIYKVDTVTPGMWGDEEGIARASEQILSSPEILPFVSVNYGHPTPLLYLGGLSMEFFGRTFLGIRFPSIVFGALSVALFYILARLFFNKTVSFSASFLMIFSYPLIILSRLAYETTALIFFQILSIITLYLAWKKKETRYYIALGLALGLGLYTYLGFRTFALILILLVIFLFIKTEKTLIKKHTHFIGALLGSLFIVSVPILSYGLTHLNEIMARANSISLFSQNYSFDYIFKEIGVSIAALSYLFFFTGDPSPFHNPSRVGTFDIMTGILFVTGLIYLFRKDKKILFFVIILLTPFIINDVFSIELVPGNYDYAVGHPNILRLAGFIPIVYFVIAIALKKLKPVVESAFGGFYTTMLVVIVGIICLYNFNLYFNQPFDKFIYKNNRVIQTNVVKYINNNPENEIFVSPSFFKDDLIRYFLKPEKQLKLFNPTSSESAVTIIYASRLTIVDPAYNKKLTADLGKYLNYNPAVRIVPILSPIDSADAVALIPIK